LELNHLEGIDFKNGGRINVLIDSEKTPTEILGSLTIFLSTLIIEKTIDPGTTFKMLIYISVRKSTIGIKKFTLLEHGIY